MSGTDEINKRAEHYLRLIDELINGIDAGDFNRAGYIPDKYIYEHLEALFVYSEMLDNGRELYRQLFDLVCQASETTVREKAARGEKIHITFLAISAAEWPADRLYRMLEEDPRFEVTVTTCPLIDRDASNRARTYMKSKQFFLEKGYRVLDNYSAEQDRVYSWEELNEAPDIVIHLSFWTKSLPECYQIISYPCSRMNLHIPYGVGAMGDSTDKKYVSTIKEISFVNMIQRNYTNRRVNWGQVKQTELLQGRNKAYSGPPKMDYFYQDHHFEEEDIRRIWKIPEGTDVNKMKRVIIAPHHSFLGYAGIRFSTFAKNVYFWLYLAEKYKDEITFVFKPHPNLCQRAVEAGVFKDVEEYDSYIAKWNAMPNARAVEEGSYLEVFVTSDAMIMDSISFIAEYMYVNKPLLFLTRPEQAFTTLGAQCISTYSKVPGSDYIGIERFLQDTVLQGEDDLCEQRKAVFSQYFDYAGDNHCLASEYIYNDISMMLMPVKSGKSRSGVKPLLIFHITDGAYVYASCEKVFAKIKQVMELFADAKEKLDIVWVEDVKTAGNIKKQSQELYEEYEAIKKAFADGGMGDIIPVEEAVGLVSEAAGYYGSTGGLMDMCRRAGIPAMEWEIG